MKSTPGNFWLWFRGFATRLTAETISETLQDELLSQLHHYDKRLFFLLSTNTQPHELIVTAEGNSEAFESADTLVAAAPEIANWKFFSLKPPLGFDFRHTDGPISLDVARLWFMPTSSRDAPGALGIVLGLPDADFILEHQSVDTAYCILEASIGERECAREISHVAVDDLPDDPAAGGYLVLPQLPAYIAFHKRRSNQE